MLYRDGVGRVRSRRDEPDARRHRTRKLGFFRQGSLKHWATSSAQAAWLRTSVFSWPRRETPPAQPVPTRDRMVRAKPAMLQPLLNLSADLEHPFLQDDRHLADIGEGPAPLLENAH